jgi:endonuclease III
MEFTLGGTMKMLDSREIERAFELLSASIPAPATELVSTNTYTLLVAVVLSAQMTDRGVNRATAPLFAVADTPEKMLALGEERLTQYIRSINYYQAKVRYVLELSRLLIERFGGEVPSTREELESLPGVGRKTANVMLNVAFGQATMPVDTHVLRLAPRAGLSAGTKPREVEEDLLRIIPARFLRDAHHLLVLHGRYVCTAYNPKCDTCCIASLCPKNGVAD